MKKILIVGANFINKGAQSMLFAIVSEVRKRNQECEIYFATFETMDDNAFTFKKVFSSTNAQQIALGNRVFYTRCKCFAKDVIKFVCGRHNNLWKYNGLKQLIQDIDLIIDISGFNLGEKWGKCI